jgi:hypothetical protein
MLGLPRLPRLPRLPSLARFRVASRTVTTYTYHADGRVEHAHSGAKLDMPLGGGADTCK